MTTFLALVANAGDGTIAAVRVGSDSLARLAVSELPGACNTFVVDGARDLLYAGCKGDPALVVTYRLDRATGVLSELGRVEVEAPLTYVELAHGGTVLLGASYGGGTGYTWPVCDGVLGGVASRIAHPNLHCVVATPDAHAYFVSLGADMVAQFAVSDAGVLTPLDPATVALPEGSGPRHLVLDAAARNGYLVTEFSGEVFRLSRDAASGVLSLAEGVSIVDPAAGLARSRLGADPVAEHLVWGADVHVADRLLVASERSASTLATVALGDGRLGRVLAVTKTEAQPRGFALTPDGTRVLAVGERSTHLALSRLEADGRLTLLDRAETGRGANWVRVLPARPGEA